MKSKRKAQQEKRRKKKVITNLSLGGVALVAIALLVYAFTSASQPTPGEAVTVMPDSGHVPDGTDPGPYNSDPPTSGRHYNDPLEAGFYNEGDVPGAYPAGHVVHSLEHGYVVFWYNCAQVAGGDCTELKAQIQGVLDAENNFKVLAYPWSSTDVPVALTSWGRMLKLEEFDPQVAEDFVEQNRNKSPEPNAP